MKAMILAAGKGERLRPFTLTTPKPLLTVSGKPLIVWHIERLVNAGITDIIINVAWLADKIEATLGNGHQFGVNIFYSRENDSFGTGGGIKNALPFLGEDPFILVSGDATTDFPFSALKNRQLDQHCLGHLVLVENPEHHPNGDFCLEEGVVKVKKSDRTSLTYGNVSLLSPSLFSGQMKSQFPITVPFLQAIKEGRLSGEYFTGYFCNVDTIERLHRVERDRLSGKIKDHEI